MSLALRLTAAAGLLAALAGCVVDATPAQPTPVVVSPAPAVLTPPTGTVVVQPQ